MDVKALGRSVQKSFWLLAPCTAPRVAMPRPGGGPGWGWGPRRAPRGSFLPSPRQRHHCRERCRYCRGRPASRSVSRGCSFSFPRAAPALARWLFAVHYHSTLTFVMRRLFYIIDTIKFLFLGTLVFIYTYSTHVSSHQEQNRFSCPTSALGITLTHRKSIGAAAAVSPV